MQKNELVEQLKNRQLDNVLMGLYSDEKKIDYQNARYLAAAEKFEQLFGGGDISIYSAPGRIEIIGNQTDHQHGKVLTAAINSDVIGVVKKTDDDFVRIVSGDNPEIKIDINMLESESDENSSASLIKGMLNGLKGMDYKLGGFSAYITSDIPIGSAFASSASFETLIGSIVSGLFNDMKITAREIAQIGQYSENIYYGKPSGLMDQMTCSVGGFVYIDFSNPAEPQKEKIEEDFSDYCICMVDTKKQLVDPQTESAQIVSEMKAVATELGKEYLNEVSKEEFINGVVSLREKFSDRALLRAIHFFEENERVSRAFNALKSGNRDEFLRLEKESGRSSYMYLQNAVSADENEKKDLVLAMALSESLLGEGETYRIHASGFSGVIEVFVKNENADAYKAKIEEVFPGCVCSVLKIRKYGGIKVV